MRPNFALSLSLDGILLLHDAGTGWIKVGEADPSSPSLDEDLAVLRHKAMAIDSSGLYCKLILPDDQIRYLTLHTPAMDDTARKEAAGAALVECTPYPLADLVFDICADGESTHVAAVAKETLAEAESFALAHGMHPICCVAQPREAAFSGEPFFGATKAAGDLDVERTPESGQAVEEAPVLESDETEISTPSFVSRRTVPTFRTEEADTAANPEISLHGFAEGHAPFEAAPKSTASSSNTKVENTVLPAPTSRARKPKTDKERFTIFGASERDGGFGRWIPAGGMLVLAVVLVAGVGAFASGALGSRVSAFLDRILHPEPVAQFTAPLGAAPQLPDNPTTPEANIELAALEQTLSDEDTAVLDALRVPVPNLTPLEPETTLPDKTVPMPALDIWQYPPDVPSPAAIVTLDDLYVTGIDPVNFNFDAVALPSLSAEGHDLAYLRPASPAPAGTVFRLDTRAMVIATPEGALNPDGIRVFSGPPPAKPPLNLLKTEDPGVDLTERLRLAAFRPQSRPGDLIETSERATFSGLTRSELGQMRPRMRPRSDQENALASASLVRLDGDGSQSLLKNETDNGFDEASGRAVSASLRPDARPKDFGNTVAKAKAAAPTVLAATATTTAPRVITPKIPSSASASREATVKNALNLRQVNLIGVFGSPSDRSALVRLSNGSYRKVQVGDRIDGGQVSAIGDAELRYQKSGRAVVLKMPRG